MTIFILLGISILFFVITGILIAIDNYKRKNKKKILPFHFRVIGILCTCFALIFLSVFVKSCISFHGVECGERKILLRTTMDRDEITLASADTKLERTLNKKTRAVIADIEQGNSKQSLRYTDALLNKKILPLQSIHEVKYSKDLSKNRVQIVEYLVNTKSGAFTKPGIYYYIIFSQELKNKWDQDDKKNNTTKEKKTKKQNDTQAK